MYRWIRQPLPAVLTTNSQEDDGRKIFAFEDARRRPSTFEVFGHARYKHLLLVLSNLRYRTRRSASLPNAGENSVTISGRAKFHLGLPHADRALVLSNLRLQDAAKRSQSWVGPSFTLAFRMQTEH